jgi:arylformamidase
MAHNDPNWFEREYYPSLAIPNAGAIFNDWKKRAAATRAALKFQPDIRYGSHKREVLDFYPAANPQGCVVYIHGGYWVEFSKFETSWVADGFVNQNLSVALINYPLCPEVSIADIRDSCARAFAHLYKSVLSEAERAAIVVTGHSAGGHLAAAHLVEDWAEKSLPQNPIAGVIALSGVFDVAPLAQTSLNDELRLTRDSAAALDLNKSQPIGSAKFALAVGQQESAEFHRQSTELARNWKVLRPQVLDIAGTHHFTIVDTLADQGGQLNRLAVAMARGY